MKCPYCHHDETQVIDTRVPEEGNTIRRRRRCASCDKRFTTYERVELTMPSIVKKNGSRTEFESAKLRASLMLALRKRPVSAEAVDTAIEHIEEKHMIAPIQYPIKDEEQQPLQLEHPPMALDSQQSTDRKSVV